MSNGFNTFQQPSALPAGQQQGPPWWQWPGFGQAAGYMGGLGGDLRRQQNFYLNRGFPYQHGMQADPRDFAPPQGGGGGQGGGAGQSDFWPRMAGLFGGQGGGAGQAPADMNPDQLARWTGLSPIGRDDWHHGENPLDPSYNYPQNQTGDIPLAPSAAEDAAAGRYVPPGRNPADQATPGGHGRGGKSAWAGLTGKEKMQFAGTMGGAAGSLAGGLMNLFGGQPDALLNAYKDLKTAYQNLEDPDIIKKLWDSPVIQQLAKYKPELVAGISESVDDYETYGEGDPALRAKEDEALARISDRARRGDPLSQRIQSQQAAGATTAALGRAGQTAQQLAARRGMPGGAGYPGVSGPMMQQAAIQAGSQIGTNAVMAGRADRSRAELAAFQGASGIRAGREASKERALNVRNNFRNAMSNRDLRVQMSNQGSRQSAADKNQALGQSIHERNLYANDQRRIMNRRQRNTWERERYGQDRQRVIDEGSMDIAIAKQKDQMSADRRSGVQGLLSGAGQMAGYGFGMGMGA